MPDPAWLVERVAAAQRGLDASLATVDDAALREPSALPGWSRAHVLAHVAGNAAALAAMCEAHAVGREVVQYGGSLADRAAEIERWAALAAAELVRLVESSGQRCLTAMRAMPDWDGTLVWTSGRHPARRAPFARWREIEVHRIDLDLGYGWADWPTEFVEAQLAAERPRLAERADGTPEPDVPPAALLAWLFGRGPAGLPELPAWG